MKRKLSRGFLKLSLFLSALSIIMVMGYGQSFAADRIIRVAHAASESNPGHTALLKFNDILQEKTNGRIQVQIFANAQLGSERELIEGLQLGNVNMCFVFTLRRWQVFKKTFSHLICPFCLKTGKVSTVCSRWSCRTEDAG